ncbi:hypothetical protein [uncultured Polaribacter sp.]|uniref:hypothetical protein n=1 Tax=uncultured Polaribacter sp. TaxID=174711 RepID=UPI0030D8AA0C|tara:strand:+ start:1771 stop:2193 length:423 start_codon:yes stop_codon:yes gene_type:complete
MKHFLQVIVVFLVIGCNQKKELNIVITEGTTAKQSEMAALMLQMYQVNLENKGLILEGKTPNDFPKEFLNIHTAQLTDPSVRTPNFEVFSEMYINTFQQEAATDKVLVKEKHNATINSCIACHNTTCIGPIPKIKKLLIP